jgi:hypothetical protein
MYLVAIKTVPAKIAVQNEGQRKNEKTRGCTR